MPPPIWPAPRTPTTRKLSALSSNSVDMSTPMMLKLLVLPPAFMQPRSRVPALSGLPMLLLIAACVKPTAVERAMSLARQHQEEAAVALLRTELAQRPE